MATLGHVNLRTRNFTCTPGRYRKGNRHPLSDLLDKLESCGNLTRAPEGYRKGRAHGNPVVGIKCSQSYIHVYPYIHRYMVHTYIHTYIHVCVYMCVYIYVLTQEDHSEPHTQHKVTFKIHVLDIYNK